MIATEFQQSNLKLGPPEGMEPDDCYPLPVYTDGAHCISRWLPTAEDLEAILAGKPVWLWVLSGTTQPPVLLTTENPWPEAVDDGGTPA